jgi:hydroxymethylpyrimidine/phosphomethylpyrimidine kinase
MAAIAIALTIAGSDSSGGAGIQADLKTFSALGVYGASVLTALTAQNTRGVQGVFPVPASFVVNQLASVMSDLDVKAIKTGMLANAEIVRAVADDLQRRPKRPVVVDPVMVATSGDLLLDPDAVESVVRALLPLADLVTPNLAEAARLTERPIATSLDEMVAQGRVILSFGPRAVLVKGGHGAGSDAIDVLVSAGGSRMFSGPRFDTPHTHGTGCTLSSAIAACLARGLAMDEAVARAKTYVSEAIAAGRDLGVGRGHGPVDHLHAVRKLDLPPPA